MPFEHRVGWLSQEFGGALPSAVIAEMETLPAGFLEQLLEYRRFSEYKALYDSAKDEAARASLPWGPLMELVQECDFVVNGGADPEGQNADG